MSEDDELHRRVRRLALEQAETRWLSLRLDDDVKEIRVELRDVRRTQGEHTEILDGHTRILVAQSEILDSHSAKLDEHSALLEEHSAKLDEHTARFDAVDAQLASLTQMVGQVLDRLPEPER